MRVCRFGYDEIVLIGFFADKYVIPIDQASEAYCQQFDESLALPAADDLLDLLPPAGASHREALKLHKWLESLDLMSRDELMIPIVDVQILVPIPNPPKLLFLAGNYAKHIEEHGGTAAERAETFPYVFMKPSRTTLTNPGDPILLPCVSPDHIDWECELGVVIGKRCRNVSEEDALDYVAGYTVVNDVSDRSFRPNPDRKPRERDPFFDWLHGKWHDTFCPMGPCILAADQTSNPQQFPIRLTVNGQIKQDASTADMIFPVAAVISFISRFTTLEPGDVIATGTPSGVGSSTGQYLKPGDAVRATIGPIGTLMNPVRTEGCTD